MEEPEGAPQPHVDPPEEPVDYTDVPDPEYAPPSEPGPPMLIDKLVANLRENPTKRDVSHILLDEL